MSTCSICGGDKGGLPPKPSSCRSTPRPLLAGVCLQGRSARGPQGLWALWGPCGQVCARSLHRRSSCVHRYRSAYMASAMHRLPREGATRVPDLARAPCRCNGVAGCDSGAGLAVGGRGLERACRRGTRRAVARAACERGRSARCPSSGVLQA